MATGASRSSYSSHSRRAGVGAARWARLGSLGMALRAASRPGAPSLAARLSAVPRMVSASLQGRYAGLSGTRIAALLAAALYVLSPVDLVPEALFGIFGLADDAMLVSWLAGALLVDTDAYLARERSGAQDTRPGTPQDAPIPSYVVR